MDIIYVIKIQALWRGFMSRKGKIVPCTSCGHPMTITPKEYPETMSAVFIHTCSWCATKPCDCLECKMGKVIFCPGCGDDDCTGICTPCNICYSDKCDGYCERYIPCCMCGNDCADGDYESWRFCSRRCMVDAGRD